MFLKNILLFLTLLNFNQIAILFVFSSFVKYINTIWGLLLMLNAKKNIEWGSFGDEKTENYVEIRMCTFNLNFGHFLAEKIFFNQLYLCVH